jgi:hypothetical protein
MSSPSTFQADISSEEVMEARNFVTQYSLVTLMVSIWLNQFPDEATLRVR